MDKKSDKILLFSGGLDSYIAWHYLGKPPTVYFHLGTPYSGKEIKVIKELIPETKVEYILQLGDRQIGANAYIPYRNLHLALLANKYADTIIIAGLKDDMVNDKNEEIFMKFSMLMSDMMQRKIRVESPFWEMTKEQVVRWYLQQGLPVGDLQNTISCYTDTIFSNQCWVCPACFRKWCALKANKVPVPPFENIPLIQDYLARAKAGIYEPERNATIIQVVADYLQGIQSEADLETQLQKNRERSLLK